MTLNKNQSLKQRAGKLIETYVRDQYDLSENKRQQTKGYFDAYDKTNIYEIKAVKTMIRDKSPRITLIKENHYELERTGCGKYVIIIYNLINKDKNLKLIQDINILKEIEITAETMTEIISKYGTFHDRKYKTFVRHHIRVKLDDIIRMDKK